MLSPKYKKNRPNKGGLERYTLCIESLGRPTCNSALTIPTRGASTEEGPYGIDLTESTILLNSRMFRARPESNVVFLRHRTTSVAGKRPLQEGFMLLIKSSW